MKIVIIGGHLTPALAVIEEFPKDAQILYIGRKYALEGDRAVSFEYQEVTNRKIPFKDLKTGRLQRSFTRYTIPSLLKIPIGLMQAGAILKKFKPDVVVGFGGYVSFPVILAAFFLKLPVVIHEQTQDAGAANRYLVRFAKKVCISFESSKKYFPSEKVVLTGNPVRKSIINPKKRFGVEIKDNTIFITGGSLGSHFINKLIMDCLPKLLDKYNVIHQAGGAEEFSDFDKLSILKEGLNKNKKDKYVVSKFFSQEEIGGILFGSTLVVARAGINTVSELTVLNKPSLLIPIPKTQKNEQGKNALLLKKSGLCEIADQNTLGSYEFLEKINLMMKNITKYKIKDESYFNFSNAAKKIVEVIYETAKDHSN